MKPVSKGQKYATILLWPWTISGWFCLLWNVLGVHKAVGLGTVGYLTAVGVYYTSGLVVGSISFIFWCYRYMAERYNVWT